MNHLLNSMNINISSPNDKRDLIIALFVVLFFGGLSWWLLKPNFVSSNHSVITTNNTSNSPESGNAISTFVNSEDKEGQMEKEESISIQKEEISGQVQSNVPKIIALDDIERRTLEEAVHSVEFKENSAELMRSSRPSLYRIAKIMKKYPDYQLRIIAYTQSPEKELARDRAEVCFNYLVAEEIESGRIEYEGRTYKATANKNSNDRLEFDLSY